MAINTLEVIDLHVRIKDKEIIKGVSFKLQTNEVVALVGPNGHGKSCLLLTIMGHPNYEVTNGEILFNGKDVLLLPVNERAKLGLFLAFQNPPEISGVANLDFYKSIVHDESLKGFAKFYHAVNTNLKEVGLNEETSTRELNVGFSGGEKKRHELMQMLLLNPNFVMLDEIDSGLDVDAISIVADIINKKKAEIGTLLISHYSRLFKSVSPTRALVLMNGKIVYDGDSTILEDIDKNGFQDLGKRLKIRLEKTEAGRSDIMLGSCATKRTKKNDK